VQQTVTRESSERSSSMSNKKIVLILHQRIDPSLFDTRVFTTKIVKKEKFIPDFICCGTAFIFVSATGEEHRLRILKLTQNFARTVVLICNPSPQFQQWLNDLTKPPTLFVLPGDGPSFLSSMIVAILPLIKAMSTPEGATNVVDSVRQHAQTVIQQHFAHAKSTNAIAHSISCSTGIDQPLLCDLLDHYGSLQRLGQSSRMTLRDLGLQEKDVQAIASFFDEQEVEAPGYM